MSIKLIKDTILGNILFSRLESVIFSDPLFNRLHHITQNSMAYKVFPSDKTSRFSHSIGVMHIASQMFKNGLANSTPANLKEFFDDKESLINDIILTALQDLPGFLSEKLKNIVLNDSWLNKMYDYLEHFYDTGFINHVTFYNTIFRENKYITLYLLLIEALRIAALLHDVGHLPFSHLTEFAFEDLYNKLDSKSSRLELNKKESEIKDVLKEIIDDEFKIHEIVGNKISEVLFFNIRQDIESRADNESKKAWFLLITKVISAIIAEIKKGKRSRLYSLFSIISYDIDADRIDFILRDSASSGLIDNVGDIDRVLKLYCLARNNDDKLDDSYIFLPSIQSLNDIQEIIMGRYRVYKYLVNHHKVKRSDYILQSSITMSMLNELKEDDGGNSGKIRQDNLFSIVEIIKQLENASLEQMKRIIVQLTQFTENWVFSILNRNYINLLVKFHEELNDNDKKLMDLFKEIFTGEKIFLSLWKKEYEFNCFLSDLAQELGEGFSNENIMDSLATIDLCWDEKITERFENSGKLVLIARTKISSGIKELKLVDIKRQSDSLYDFNKISKVPGFFKSDLSSSIKFFVFYKCDNSAANQRADIYRELLAYLSELIKKNSLN